jgi:RNA polymerase sigma-70 factor (ECF subfamily)
MPAGPYSLPVPEPEPALDLRALSDGELATCISAGRGGDREAESELCRRFALRIRLYGLRHLGDPASAADLVQDVLMVVLDRLRREALHEPERLASFVLGTSRRSVLDRRRGEARREALLARFGGDLAPAGVAPPLLDLDRIDRCLEGLPPRERAVLQLTFYAQRSGTEIARELDTTNGNVRVVRHRAVAHLRACLDAGEVTP